MRRELPHPAILLAFAILIAAIMTWVLPAGEYDRKDDAATGRRIVVPGTYHPVASAPVGLFATAMSAPRGFGEAVDIIAVVLFVGGAWVVVDRIGTLGRVVGVLAAVFGKRGWIAIPLVSIFFATMGALENMQEEIIPDGHVIDTVLHGLATPLGQLSGVAAMFLMIPLQSVIHVVVPSVSGQAVLTMPVLVPLSDLLGQTRQAAVLAYQAGAGLTELLTPTNGALMGAVLLHP